MSNINQLLVQAEAADWSSLIQCLQQLILGANSEHPEIVKNREYLLTLALSILGMGGFQQRWEISKVLTHLDNIAIPPLIEILEDEDAEEELHWYAARTLGEFQHPEAIAPIVELLKTEEDEELKAIAATALGQMGTVAITSLTELLVDNNYTSRINLTASAAMPSLREASLSETLTRTPTASFLTQHPATDIANIKSAIALSLGQLGKMQAIEPLISLLADSNTSVRLHAIAALKNLDGEAIYQQLQQLANNDATTPDLQQGIAIALAEW
ncbi:MAG: HEAT repeat domain-containing protein [Nostoc sp.]|uniref:HEAT repeat domain-containing protein n=1 Tax=Nostoc sp. TaxID=1180 RepID=UPI002FFC3072